MTDRGYGRLPKTADRRDYRAAPASPYTGDFVDLTAGFADPPYDQGAIGSCVAQATAAAVDYARVKQGLPPLHPPSRLFIYYTGRLVGGYPAAEDSGLQIRDGFKAVADYGAPPESDWPYDTTRFAAQPPIAAYDDGALDQAVVYGAVADSDIDAMVASGWPVVIGFDVYESFEFPATASSGVMPVPDVRREKRLGGHATIVCSTPLDGRDSRVGGKIGIKYRKVRNSWGTGWGQGGWYWHPVPAMDSPQAGDFWTVQTVESPNPPTPPPLPPPVVDPDRTLADATLAWSVGRHTGANRAAAVAVSRWRAAKGL